MKTIQHTDKKHSLGSFVVKTHESGKVKWYRDAEGKLIIEKESLKLAMGKPLYAHPRIKNLVVSGSGGYGRNLIIRQLAGDATYGMTIDSAKIGTGSTAPVDGDTDIEIGVLADIPVALYEVTNDTVVISFFIPSEDLVNGTYNEFAIFIGARLFARAIISPAFVKGTNEDTTVEYTIELTP